MEQNELSDWKARCSNFTFKGQPWGEVDHIPLARYELHRLLNKTFAYLLPADKKSSVLDVGCGLGFFVYFLQKEGYDNARGVDINAKEVELAIKAGVKNIEQRDLFEYLPLHTDQFDLIIAYDVIEHFTKPEAMHMLDLAHRSLTPGGRVLIITPNVGSFCGMPSAFDFYHEIGLTPLSLRQLMSACHFSKIVIRGLEPIPQDFKSLVRLILWKGLKVIYSVVTNIELGTQREMTARIKRIYTPKMYAVGTKAE